MKDINCCKLCKNKKRLIKHHTSYLPQELISVCDVCHQKIHKGDIPDLNPSRRMASIFYSGKNILRKKSNGFALRPLTTFELKIKKEMKSGRTTI